MNDSKNTDDRSTARVGWLIALARPQIPRFAVAAIFMAVSAAATAGYAFLVGPVLKSLFVATGTQAPSDGISSSGVMASLTDLISGAEPLIIAALIVATAVIKGLAHFLEQTFTIIGSERVLLNLRAAMYRGLLSLSPFGPDAHSPGETVARFTVDAETIGSSVTNGLMGFVSNTLQIVALAALAISLDPILGLMGLVAFPPAAFTIHRIGVELRRRKRALYDAFGDLGTTVEETGNGLGVILPFGAQPLMARRFEEKSSTLMKRVISAMVLKVISSPFNEILGACALGLAIWYASGEIGEGNLTPGQLVSFFTALVLLYRPVKAIGQAQHSVQTGLAAMDRLEPLMRTPEEDTSQEMASREISAPSSTPSVELVKVSAGYHGEGDVLKGIDLKIQPGERVTVVGPSGSGKSTLVNLLCGLLPLREGAILIDGQPLAPGPQASGAIFAPVPQEPFLFDADIEMNVRCGRPEASRSDVLSACRVAGVMDFADKLEGGLAANVGHRGSALSVGQRQRVCLARALLSRAPVLLLDEMTASIDGETERSIVDQLDSHLNSRTAVVITHRRSTAAWAQRMTLLENGVVEADGAPSELLEKNPRIVALFGGGEGVKSDV